MENSKHAYQRVSLRRDELPTLRRIRKHVSTTPMDMWSVRNDVRIHWRNGMDAVTGIILVSLGAMALFSSGIAKIIENWADRIVAETMYCWRCGAPNNQTRTYCYDCRAMLNP